MFADDGLLGVPVAREWHLLQLQVQELLEELRFDYESQDVAATIARVVAAVKDIPEHEVQPSAAASFLESLPLSTQRAMRFKAPTVVEVTGAYAHRTVIQAESTIDVTVTIPSTCLLQKDQLNHQYFARRALYLVTISEALRDLKTSPFKRQRWEYEHNCPWKPVLVLDAKLSKGSSSGLWVRINTAIDHSAFPLAKLQPGRNNLRSVTGRASEGSEQVALLPTPHYNNSILEDVLPDPCFRALERASAQLPEFLNASLLIKIWARQQGLSMAHNDFCGELLPCYAAHLAQKGRLEDALEAWMFSDCVTGSTKPTAAMNPLQMFKVTLKSLSDPKAFKTGIFMERDVLDGLPDPPKPSAFQGTSDVCFVDPSGWLNLAAHISSSAIHQLQDRAADAIWLLEDRLPSAEDAIQALFLKRLPSLAGYDYFWKVDLPDAQHIHPTSDLPTHRQREDDLEVVARRALGRRATLVRASSRPLKTQDKLQAPELHHSSIILAVKVDVQHAFSAVDIGPPADSPEALAFKQFWQNKAEMRKFLDGRICEAVPWHVEAAFRHTVLDAMLNYVLPHKLGAVVQGCSNCLDWVLEQRLHTRQKQVDAMRLLDAAANTLGTRLRNLKTLPLKVIAFQPISAECRHTSPFSPMPHPFAGIINVESRPLPRCLQPIEALLQVEGSGKWPDDVEAFRKMKAALGIQIADLLFTSFGTRASASERHVDVFMEGFVFRLFIFSERDNAVALKDAQFAEELTVRQKQLRHHAFIAQVAGRYPTYRGTAALAIRWMASMLMSHQISVETVELVSAAVYTTSQELAAESPVSGFLSFLRLISRHEWGERPLIVDVEGTMDAAMRQASDAAFQEAKKEGPVPGLPLVTPHDPQPGHWTVRHPTPQVAKRLVALAHRSLQLLEAQCWDPWTRLSVAGIAAAWDPGLPDFDALIFLRKGAIPNADQALRLPGDKSRLTDKLLHLAGFMKVEDEFLQPSKRSRVALHNIPPKVAQQWGDAKVREQLIVGFDPVRLFLGLIEKRFGHLGVFFYDHIGGDLIAAKWRPQAFVAREVVPEIAHTAMLLKQEASPEGKTPLRKAAKLKAKASACPLCAPDVVRVMSDIKQLGAGLVADVWLQHQVKELD